MVGSTRGAAVTATIMVFEKTRDYTAILPVILTVTLPSAVRHLLASPWLARSPRRPAVRKCSVSSPSALSRKRRT